MSTTSKEVDNVEVIDITDELLNHDGLQSREFVESDALKIWNLLAHQFHKPNLLSWQVHDDTSCDQHCNGIPIQYINKDNRELRPESDHKNGIVH